MFARGVSALAPVRAFSLGCLLLVACGGQPGGTCLYDHLLVKTDDGVSGQCFDYGRQLQPLLGLFWQRFGAVNLAGFTIEVSPDGNVRGDHSAWTDWSARTVTISESSIHQRFAHELYHVQLGPASADHGEATWCSELSPWEIAQDLEDERAYLGCPH